MHFPRAQKRISAGGKKRRQVHRLLGVGAATGILGFLFPLDFMPLVTAALFGCALGRTVFRAAPVIADKANNINFQGGSFTMVVVYLCLIGVACLLLIVSCFQRETK